MNNRIVVLGGGESGVGAAVLAKVKGFDVFLSDKGKIEDRYVKMLEQWEIPFEQGGHTEDLILNASEVIKSPGIPSTVPLVKKIEAAGIGIVSEIEFAGRYDNAKKICSFQLDNCYEFRPDIAVITNITPDHLDRYGYDMENYVRAKFRIVRNLRPEDCFIFDSDDEITINHLDKIVTEAKKLPFTQKDKVEQGAYLEDGRIVIKYEDEECDIYLKELSLGGIHNVYNSMAAALAAKATGIDNKVIRESLETFKPIEHRLEPVMSVGGVLYINDSKATNVDAAWYALECQTRPVVWIVGGTDKGNDYKVLESLVSEKVKAIVCLGVDNRKIHEAFESIVGRENIKDTMSAEEAVRTSAAFAEDGDVVLLSPCCASFDLFTCYEDRGEQFKAAVRKL